jgi:hypothetical protein
MATQDGQINYELRIFSSSHLKFKIQNSKFLEDGFPIELGMTTYRLSPKTFSLRLRVFAVNFFSYSH